MTEGDEPVESGFDPEFGDLLALDEDLAEGDAPQADAASGAQDAAAPPPPLLFQTEETVDTVHWSEPGYEPHTAPRPMDESALDRAFGPSFDPADVGADKDGEPVVAPATSLIKPGASAFEPTAVADELPPLRP